jgi:hypothetical protein
MKKVSYIYFVVIKIKENTLLCFIMKLNHYATELLLKKRLTMCRVRHDAPKLGPRTKCSPTSGLLHAYGFMIEEYEQWRKMGKSKNSEISSFQTTKNLTWFYSGFNSCLRGDQPTCTAWIMPRNDVLLRIIQH